MINQELAFKVIQICVKNGLPMQLSRLMAAQSAHETGNFTNNNFLLNNNGFGYKRYEGSEYQKGAGIKSSESDSYADYETFEDSIEEVVAWIKRRVRKAQFPSDLTKIQKPEDYATLLKQCGYFGGPLKDYIKGVTYFLNHLK